MRRMIKYIYSISMCMVLLLGLWGCEKKEDWIFDLHGEKIEEKDVAAFAFVYATEYNVKNREQLDERYEGSVTYGEYYKEELEEEIVSTVLLYKAAGDKIKLSDQEKEQITVGTENVIERFGKEQLEKNGLTKADIENVYKMKISGDVYLRSISETVSVEQQEEEDDNPKDRYVKVYQVTFQTVQTDEEGMVKSDEEGNLKKLSSSEIATKKQEAYSFAESIKEGERMEELLTEYNVVGMEKYLKYTDLESSYKAQIDIMSVGDISEVIESDYGFHVIQLLSKEDKEYAKQLDLHEKEKEEVSVREKELERLYSEYAQPNKDYKNPDLWKNIDMKDYIRE